MAHALKEKATYQSPIVMPLGELAAGAGTCVAGGDVNSGICKDGNAQSTGTCQAGPANYYGTKCAPGTAVNTRRRCSNGSIPQ